MKVTGGGHTGRRTLPVGGAPGGIPCIGGAGGACRRSRRATLRQSLVSSGGPALGHSSRPRRATFEPVSYPLDNAVFQWEDGWRKLQQTRSEPTVYRALGRVVIAVQDELRKRLGSTFTIAELAALYREDSDWGLEVAIETVPNQSRVWDSSTGVDAAFYLYMREAADFAGGSVRRSDSRQA